MIPITTIHASELELGDSIIFDATGMKFAKVAKIENEDGDFIVTTEQNDELFIEGDASVIILA
jgi:hypothetical protein